MTKKSREQEQPKVTDLLLELGDTYLEHGEYDKAITKLTKLIQLDQTNSEAYTRLSKVYILKKQFDKEAQGIFEETLKYTSDDILIKKVLSQIYLRDERLDEGVLKIYFYVLQHDKQNSENLFQRILQLSLKKNKLETIQSLMKQLEPDSIRFRQALQSVLNDLWKNKKFYDAAQFFKTVLESEGENTLFLRLLLYNQLKAHKASSIGFSLVDEDQEFLMNFVRSKNTLDRLIDIHLFLAINRLLKKIPLKAKPETIKQIEEFEIFLSGDSFSTIWDIGLNKNISTVSDAGVDFNLLWDKINFWNSKKKLASQIDTEALKKEILNYIFNQANCMLIIKATEEKFQQIEELFLESTKTFLNNDDNPLQGIYVKDGLITFGENVETLIKIAVDFTDKQSAQKEGESIKINQSDIVIHTISLTNNRDFTYLFDDLEMALNIFDPEQQLISNKITTKDSEAQSRIFITSSANNIIGDEGSALFTPSDIITEHPVSYDKFLVYNLCKTNTLAKIKKGDITKIGKYNLIEELRQNEIFVSYKAIDSYLERPVIVKILRPEFIQANTGFITGEVFLNNTKLLGKINHPDIALIYDMGKEKNLYYFAREYVEGEPLMIPKKINKKNDWQRTVQLGINIAEVLVHPHKNDIIHGRLKPDNVFVIDKNSVKLTDFQITDVHLPVQQLDNGSLNYLTYHAPEFIKDNHTDLFSDIYSLGVILYELLTGHNPFFFKEKHKIIDFVLNKKPASITKHNSKLPKELNSIIFKAIEKEPKKRFENMREFGNELNKIILR
jgi:tetratricopeptide (TPR) repeat protein